MPSRRLVKDPERYRTVMCQNWTTTGECPYGRKCQFAHGAHELRARGAPMTEANRTCGPSPLGAASHPPQPGLARMPGASNAMPSFPNPGVMPPRASMWPSPTSNPTVGAAAAPAMGLPMPPLPPGPPPPHQPAAAHAMPNFAAQPPLPGALLPAASAPATTSPMALTPVAAGGPPTPALPLPAAILPGVTAPAPLPTPQLASAAFAARPPLPAAPPLAAAAAPSADAPAGFGVGVGRSGSVSDELARLAMRCHAAEAATAPSTAPPAGLAAIWAPEPLRCNPTSGRIEAMDGGLDSPLDPPSANSKGREVSFSTLLVRRAVSFIFDEASGGGGGAHGADSPHGRVGTASPHTAIAA